MNTTNQISKFFDVAVPEPSGGVVPTNNIASLMASQGTVNNGQVGIAEPVNITTETKDEKPTTSTEAVPAATATSASNDAPVKSETPSQPEVPTEAPKPPIAAEQPKVPSLQEVLKNQQPDTVLKELGFDDNLVKFLSGVKELDPKVLNFLNTWKEGKDVTSYLREWTTDYEKMSAEDVMRHQLQKDYPGANPAQLEALFKREVVKAYSLDSDDPDELAEGRLLLEARADKSRSALIESQKNYLFPAPPEPKAPEPDTSAQQAQQEFEVYKSKIEGNPYTKEIFANNKISVGEGEDRYNHPVNPQKLTEVLYSQEAWQKSMFHEDGSPDVETQLLVATILTDKKGFISEFAKHYKSLGGKSAIEPIENASKPDGSAPSPTEIIPKTPAEAMARHGVLR